MTSQSHDVPVPEPTSSSLLGIIDFRQVKQYDKFRKWPQLDVHYAGREWTTLVYQNLLLSHLLKQNNQKNKNKKYQQKRNGVK